MCSSLFYNEGADFMDEVKLLLSDFPGTGVFQEICEIFNNTFENTKTFAKQVTIFYCSKVHSLPIPFSKESMKVKRSIKSQPVRYMCHADTCVSHEIRDEQTLQFSLQLTDTVGAKKNCPLTRGVRFFECCARLALFSKIYYFYTYI